MTRSEQIQAQINLVNKQLTALAANYAVQQDQHAMQLQSLSDRLAALQAQLEALPQD